MYLEKLFNELLKKDFDIGTFCLFVCRSKNVVAMAKIDFDNGHALKWCGLVLGCEYEESEEETEWDGLDGRWRGLLRLDSLQRRS